MEESNNGTIGLKGTGMKIDFQLMASEVLKSLRGSQTQMALSRRLGFKFNQVHRWESGITFPSWADYVRFARECGIDPAAQLRQSLGYPGSADDLPQFLLFLAANRDISNVARLSGLSRFSLGRWLQGSSEPKFRDVLQMISRLTPRISEVAHALAGDRRLASTEQLPEPPKMDIFQARPWLTALMVSLGSSRYRRLKKHSSEVLADSIGVDAEDIEQGLADLKSAGFIKATDGKWESTERKLQDEQVYGAGIDLYWAERVGEYYRQQGSPAGGLRTAMIFDCSMESLTRIRQLFLNFCNKANAIVEGDRSDSKRVAFMQYSQIFLDELSAGKANRPSD